MSKRTKPFYRNSQSMTGGRVEGNRVIALQGADFVRRQEVCEPLLNDVGEPTAFGGRTTQKPRMLRDLHKDDVDKARKYSCCTRRGVIVTSELVETGELRSPE